MDVWTDASTAEIFTIAQREGAPIIGTWLQSRGKTAIDCNDQLRLWHYFIRPLNGMKVARSIG